MMKFYGIIGDVDPITHDGGVVFARDKDSSPEVIYFFGWEDEVKGETVERVTVYRFSLDEDLSWVDWNAVASSIGIDEEELRSQAVSDDMLTRAWAYQSAAQYHGFRYLDETPEELTLEEAEEEYRFGVDQAAEDLKPTAPKKKAASRRKNPSSDATVKRMMNPTTVPTARKHAELSEDEQDLLTYLDTLERQRLYSDPWIREAMLTGFPYYFKFTVSHEGGFDIEADGILDDVLEAAKEFGIGPHYPGEETDAKWQWTTRTGKPHWLDVSLSTPDELDRLSPYVSDFIDVKLGGDPGAMDPSSAAAVKRMMNPRNY